MLIMSTFFKHSNILSIHFTRYNRNFVLPHFFFSSSSSEWLKRQLSDPYVKRSRYENYRARSAYKLIEIDEKYKLIKPGMLAIDLGAAPGSWTQVLVKKSVDNNKTKINDAKSIIIGVDINAISPIPNAYLLPFTDFTKSLNQNKILKILGDRKADLVCSDMAPNASGIKQYDHQLIIQLAVIALQFAVQILKSKDGNFLTKIWDGAEKEKLFSLMSRYFEKVYHVKPLSSREDSSELFLLGLGFKKLNTL